MKTAPLLGLRWAIKRSFLDYIAGAPGGRGSLSEGAVATANKEIVFEPAQTPATTPPNGGRRLAFRGTATFSAHSGVLLVPIADPWVTFHGTGGELTIVDPFDREGISRLRLATFDVADHLVDEGFEHWSASDVRLAEQACELFNNVYRASEPLEPLTIILPAAPGSPG